MSLIHRIIGASLKPVFVFISKRTLPVIDGTIELQGPHDSITIIRNDKGIPHISATSDYDMYFAQGFVHAQDRLWQMELNRRVAKGTLAELFGEIALDTDRVSRIIGFARLGREDFDRMSEEHREIVQAYIDGINAYLSSDSFKLPIEFKLVKHKPSDWTSEDVMAFARVMVWQLSHAWFGEIVRAKLLSILGEKLAQELNISYPSRNSVILPKGIEFRVFDEKGILKAVQGPFLGKGGGSNSFVISGEHTASGKPFLGNDMHLALSTPSLWYEQVLENKQKRRKVGGVTVPGIPLILVGQNLNYAWGMTLAYTDCADTYVEKIDHAKKTYLFRNEERALQIVREQILIKGQKEPHVEEVLLTEHGPILPGIVDPKTGYEISLKDVALQPADIIKAWKQLNDGENWDDFVEAMKLITAPQLNVVYADVEGNIGYWCTGKTPIRAKGHTGEMPVPGWTGDFEWEGYIPFEEMPHALNPEAGYIVTANNKIVPDDFPYFLGNVWMNGFRAKRVTELIESRIKSGNKITLDDCNSIMRDIYCIPAKDLVSHILDATNDEQNSRDLREMLDILRQWDYEMAVDSVGATIYEVGRYYVFRKLLATMLDEKGINEIMGVGFHPLILPYSEYYGHDVPFLLRTLNNPQSEWVKIAGGKRTVIRQGLLEAKDFLTKRLGKNPKSWKYGRIHRATFPHAFDITPPMNYIFNSKPVPIPGNTDTPYQTAIAPENPFDNKAWSISFRMLVDTSNMATTKIIASLGQSGQLGSKHYEDLKHPWLYGEYNAYFWEDPEIHEERIEGILILTPSSEK